MGKPANKDLDFTLLCDSIDEAVLLMVLQISVRQSCCVWSQHTFEPLENGKIQWSPDALRSKIYNIKLIGL